MSTQIEAPQTTNTEPNAPPTPHGKGAGDQPPSASPAYWSDFYKRVVVSVFIVLLVFFLFWLGIILWVSLSGSPIDI